MSDTNTLDCVSPSRIICLHCHHSKSRRYCTMCLWTAFPLCRRRFAVFCYGRERFTLCWTPHCCLGKWDEIRAPTFASPCIQVCIKITDVVALHTLSER